MGLLLLLLLWFRSMNEAYSWMLRVPYIDQASWAYCRETGLIAALLAE